MQLYEMQVNKTAITRAAAAKVPYGVIGAVVRFSFSPEWEGLSKTVVFRAGDVTKDILDVDQFAVIPAECTQELGQLLEVGVYGVDAENTVAIPTMWEAIGRISEATDPSGDTSTDPALPVWAQLQERIRLLEETGVSQAEIEKAINAYFDGNPPTGKKTEQGGEIYNFYTDPVYTGDNPPKEYPGNTAAKGAHAQNFGTHADGEYSSASGWNSTASGGIAHAEGRESEASGYISHAEGYLTKATGAQSHAEGRETKATGGNSHAEGYLSEAQANYSHAEGYQSIASDTISHAEGRMTTASGKNAHSEGNTTTASGLNSHAEGFSTKAAASQAHAEGNKTEATGGSSHAEGESSKATGLYSHAEGYQTLAAGVGSHAEGVKTEASGYASHAQGYGTITTCRGQTVQGKYNVPDTPLDSNGNGTYAHIVGWGTGDTSRKNIYTLDTDGNGWFSGDVYVGEFYGRHKKLATEDKLPKTAADVGAAPTGFGLGGVCVNLPDTDWNKATANGWYAGKINGNWCVGVVSTYGSSVALFIHQRVYQVAYSGSGDFMVSMERKGYDGTGNGNYTWTEWEYVNPPMMPGVEYRTTERSGGLPVYTKTFALQPNVMTSFGIGEYDHGITGFKYLCRVEARTENYVLPLITNERTVCIAGVTSTKVKIAATKQDFTDYTSITLWYTKN